MASSICNAWGISACWHRRWSVKDVRPSQYTVPRSPRNVGGNGKTWMNSMALRYNTGPCAASVTAPPGGPLRSPPTRFGEYYRPGSTPVSVQHPLVRPGPNLVLVALASYYDPTINLVNALDPSLEALAFSIRPY